MFRRRMPALELITPSTTASGEGEQPLLGAFGFVGDDSSLSLGIRRCLATLVSIVNDSTHNMV